MTGTDTVMDIGFYGWIYFEDLSVGVNVEEVRNGHTSQILSSLHLLQTSPGLISAIFVAVSCPFRVPSVSVHESLGTRLL